jgi:hypothetical protein
MVPVSSEKNPPHFLRFSFLEVNFSVIFQSKASSFIFINFKKSFCYIFSMAVQSFGPWLIFQFLNLVHSR